jgi:hypothetical protein
MKLVRYQEKPELNSLACSDFAYPNAFLHFARNGPV